jgi:hypothetical protein
MDVDDLVIESSTFKPTSSLPHESLMRQLLAVAKGGGSTRT